MSQVAKWPLKHLKVSLEQIPHDVSKDAGDLIIAYAERIGEFIEKSGIMAFVLEGDRALPGESLRNMHHERQRTLMDNGFLVIHENREKISWRRRVQSGAEESSAEQS